jgi:hypothetical protein
MTQHVFLENETFEQTRQRMLIDTARFIEWGLAHPERIPWIPRSVGECGTITGRIKSAFWGLVWIRPDLPN